MHMLYPSLMYTRTILRLLYGEGSRGRNVHNIGEYLPSYFKLCALLLGWYCFLFDDSDAGLVNAVHGTRVYFHVLEGNI